MKTEKQIFYRKLVILLLPIAVQNLMTALVSASDAFMLGFVDQTALSAVSLAAQVQFVQNLFMLAITIGATTLAAQYWGKNDRVSVEKVLAIAMKFSMLVSLVFFAAALLFPALLMRIFTNEAALIEAGTPYLWIVSWSYLFLGFSQVYLCIMKSSGRVAKSTVYGSVAVVLNIGLNALLIYGLLGFPKLGIAGAALATSIARAVEMGLTVLENSHKDVVRLRLKYLVMSSRGGQKNRKFEKQGELGYASLYQDFWHCTAPVMGNELVWGCGFTMYSVIMGHLGSDAVAANSIANIVKNIIACVCLGLGTGSSILVGNELGKGNLELAKKYGGWLSRLSVVLGAISGGIILLISPFLGIFTASLTSEAHTYLKYMLWICGYYMIGKSVNSATIGGIFCAGGDTRFGLCCDGVTMWLVIIPIGLIAAFGLHLPVLVVYFILNLDEMVKLPAVYHHYKKYRWVKNLTREEDFNYYESEGKNVERASL